MLATRAIAPEFVVVPEVECLPPSPLSLDDFCAALRAERSKELAELRDEHALLTRVHAQIRLYRSSSTPKL